MPVRLLLWVRAPLSKRSVATQRVQTIRIGFEGPRRILAGEPTQDELEDNGVSSLELLWHYSSRCLIFHIK